MVLTLTELDLTKPTGSPIKHENITAFEIDGQVNIMLDLETMGTAMGSEILSIGAVAFLPRVDMTSILGDFYRVVSYRSCRRVGMTRDPDTLQWWERQNDQAREVLRQCETDDPDHSVSVCLTELCGFISCFDYRTSDGVQKPLIWGNGSDFDNAMLQNAARMCGLPPLWGHRQNRCYRTLKGLAPHIDMPTVEGVAVEHHALHDAWRQAAHASAILTRIGWM